MKVAFDENMPAALVRMFQTLAADKGFKRLFRNIEIVTAKNYTPKLTDKDYVRKSDVPWLRRYRKAGGKIVISGNTKMVLVPQELQALIEEGFVTFFFPEIWNHWRFPRKSGLIMVWLERIIAKGRKAKRGTLHRIPNLWTPDSDLMIINPPTPLKLREVEQPEKQTQTKPRPKRGARKPAADQTDFLLLIRQTEQLATAPEGQSEPNPSPTDSIR